MKTRLHGFETSIQSCSYFEIHSVLLKSNFHTHLKQMIIWKVYFIRFIFETLWIVSYLRAFYIRALLTSTIKYLSIFRYLMFLIQNQPGGQNSVDEIDFIGYTLRLNKYFFYTRDSQRGHKILNFCENAKPNWFWENKWFLILICIENGQFESKFAILNRILIIYIIILYYINFLKNMHFS